jgi:hypothetical protein
MVHREIQSLEPLDTPTMIQSGGLRARRVKIVLRCVAIALALADVCVSRNAIITDGVSYLDMADAFFHHNWHMVVNTYWSPLYPWIEGFFLWLAKPNLRWEYPVVHLVNLLIFAGTMAAFEFFLGAFINFHTQRSENTHGGSMLPDWAWWVLGYSLFTWTSLIMIGAGREVRPDMCVAAFVYLASGFVFRMRTGITTSRTFALFGVVLGVGYLAKAVMFPLAFVFLAVAFFSVSRFRWAARRVLISALVFIAIASPWLVVLSTAEGRLTFGQTGTLNYEHYIDGTHMWFPSGPGLKHRLTPLITSPPTFEFASPVQGTFPPWYDPSYWHEGLRPHFDAKAESGAVLKALRKYLHLVFSPRLQLYLLVGLVALFWMNRQRSLYVRTVASNWPVMIPALAAIGGYALIHTELRFVGAFVAILWLALFSGVRISASQTSRRWANGIVIGIAIFSLYRPIVVDAHTSYPAYWKAAEVLNADGVRPGDTIGVIGYESPAMEIARLARVRIIAQTREGGNRFWIQSPVVHDQVIEALEQTGVRAIFTSEDSPQVQLRRRWRRLGHSTDYVCVFTGADRHLIAGAR